MSSAPQLVSDVPTKRLPRMVADCLHPCCTGVRLPDDPLTPLANGIALQHNKVASTVVGLPALQIAREHRLSFRDAQIVRERAVALCHPPRIREVPQFAHDHLQRTGLPRRFAARSPQSLHKSKASRAVEGIQANAKEIAHSLVAVAPMTAKERVLAEVLTVLLAVVIVVCVLQ